MTEESKYGQCSCGRPLIDLGVSFRAKWDGPSYTWQGDDGVDAVESKQDTTTVRIVGCPECKTSQPFLFNEVFEEALKKTGSGS